MGMSKSDLEARTTRLERHIRILMAMLLVLAAVALLALTNDDGTIEARAFELVAPDGARRGSFRLEENNPVIALYDEHGVERLKLFYESDATGIYVLDAERTPRIGIAQFSHGGGGVALHGPDSKGAAVLYLKDEGSLQFLDVDGNLTTRLPALADQETGPPSE